MAINERVVSAFKECSNALNRQLRAELHGTTLRKAVSCLLARNHNAVELFALLSRNHRGAYLNEQAVVLRSAYDAMIQSLFILDDITDNTAKLYLDFYWIEKSKMIETLDNNPSDTAKKFSNSPKRAEAEPQIREQFEQVKKRFQTKSGKVRDTHWYENTLADLAQAVGLADEYRILQKQLSGAVHSSYYSFDEGIPYSDEHFVLFSWKMYLRVLSRLVERESGKFELSLVHIQIIELARKNLFNWQDKTSHATETH